MLKAIVSYSKKIPVPDAEYSSQGYSLSLETEITATAPEEIRAQLHDTFELVKASVEQELANGNGAQPRTKPPATETRFPRSSAGNGKASNKQIKFITDLATRRGVGLTELNAGIRRRFGVDGLYDLDRKQASAVLDGLKSKQAA